MAGPRSSDAAVRLLDLWERPDDAGEPIGCVATSFTFSAEFFEEECLTRFLGIESAPEQALAWIIEREERLAAAQCCAALVDRRHASGAHNLRWDLLGAQPPPGACFHPKVALLLWSEKLRLLVGSANLTEQGYRRNREVVGMLEYSPSAPGPRECLDGALGFLRAVADRAPAGGGRDRWIDLVVEAGQRSAGWAIPDTGVSFCSVGAGDDEELLTRVDRLLPSDSPPDSAWVVSPFFDQAGNEPGRRLWRVLRQRGEAVVRYVVAAHLGEGGYRVEAPQGLMAHPSPRSVIKLERLEPERDDREPPRERPLHAKCIRLSRSGSWDAILVGSSNFTSAGMGLMGAGANVEANLLYFHPRPDAFARSLPASRPLPETRIAGWVPSKPEDADADDGPPVLPAFFEAAIYRPDEQGLELVLGSSPPDAWDVAMPEPMPWHYTHDEWRSDGEPKPVRRATGPWTPHSQLVVRWDGKRAEWPVTVGDRDALPPAEELRDLSVDQLVRVLTSARPLHQVLAQGLRKPGGAEREGELLDPHKRVDDSGFLLQRTRRVGAALTGLRRRLERPIASRSALHWRLRGPVGATALAAALEREVPTTDEKAFLLLELAWELRWTEPCLAGTPADLTDDDARRAIEETALEIGARAQAVQRTSAAVRRHIASVLSAMERRT